jgi:Rho-type GTPase-activating protein 1/2
MTGFSVAQEEYQKEVAARKDLQAEVTRLRVQLSGQAARLTAMSAEQRTRASMEKLSLELGTQIVSLEHEVAKLRVDRDMALAEIEQLVETKK